MKTQIKSESSNNRLNSVSDIVSRLLFSLLFIMSGMAHFRKSEVFIAYLKAAPLGHLANIFGSPELLMSLSGMVFIIGGLALAVGFQARWAALSLILVLLPITVTVHLGDPTQIGHILKNLAILGGLIHFSAKGAGAYSIDSRRSKTAN